MKANLAEGANLAAGAISLYCNTPCRLGLSHDAGMQIPVQAIPPRAFWLFSFTFSVRFGSSEISIRARRSNLYLACVFYSVIFNSSLSVNFYHSFFFLVWFFSFVFFQSP